MRNDRNYCKGKVISPIEEIGTPPPRNLLYNVLHKGIREKSQRPTLTFQFRIAADQGWPNMRFLETIFDGTCGCTKLVFGRMYVDQNNNFQ